MVEEPPASAALITSLPTRSMGYRPGLFPFPAALPAIRVPDLGCCCRFEYRHRLRQVILPLFNYLQKVPVKGGNPERPE